MKMRQFRTMYVMSLSSSEDARFRSYHIVKALLLLEKKELLNNSVYYANPFNVIKLHEINNQLDIINDLILDMCKE